MMFFAAHVFQINVSDGGVPKRAVQTAVLETNGLTADTQAHPKIHGGPDRAICIYSLDLILALQTEGHPIYPGAVGENLTVAGLDWRDAQPGAQFQIGEHVIVEVTSYVTPCNQIQSFFKENNFKRISHAAEPGWARVYARVLHGGEIALGDTIQLVKHDETHTH